MLSKKYRLTVGFFKNLTIGNKKPIKNVSTTLFSVKVYSSDNKFSRFAVVISSVNFKKSVERNRLRRMVYEIIRRKEIYKTEGKDFIFFLKKQTLKTTTKELELEISKSLFSAR